MFNSTNIYSFLPFPFVIESLVLYRKPSSIFIFLFCVCEHIHICMQVTGPQDCQHWYFISVFSFHVHPSLLLSLSHSVFTVLLCRCVISVSLSPQVSFFLFIVFVVYTMLPFSMRDAIIASVLTSASHTIVLSVCLSTTADHMEPIVWQVRQSNTSVG